jgi:hypothetical protein
LTSNFWTYINDNKNKIFQKYVSHITDAVDCGGEASTAL